MEQKRKGRPTLPVSERRIPLDVMMKPALVDKIDQKCAEMDVSRSEFISRVLEWALTDEKEKTIKILSMMPVVK